MNAHLSTLLLSASALALAGQARAQAAAPPVSGQIQEIVVTATRRAEPLQTVPVAVQAITGEAFIASAYKNPTDLQYLSPSVQVSASGGIGFNVRGVGTNSFNAATEQTVGLVVDNVVYGFVDDIGADFSDVDRIEILRGPQGTQFGKNASAGVVSATTRRPSTDGFHLDAHGSWGTYNDSNSHIFLNAPISSTLAGSLTASYQNRDGWVDNPVRKTKEGGQDQWGLKGKLLWKPTDKLSVFLSADYRFSRWNPNFLSTYRVLGVGAGTTPPGFGILNYGIVPGPENTVTGISSKSYRHTATGGVSAEVNYDLDGFTLTSVTAYRAQSKRTYATLGGTPVVYVEGPGYSQANQWSQEFRLTSPAGSRLEYVGGVYLYRRSSHAKSVFAGPFGGLATFLYGPGASIGFSGGQDISSYEVKSAAGFADGKFRITDKLKLIGGVRLTYDKATAAQDTLPLPKVFALGGKISGPGVAETDNTDVSYRAGLQYTFAPDIMGYVTASRGYKGPLAITVAGSNARIVQPETVHAYEAGFKSTLLERRLKLNVAVFSETFKNFQTSVLDATLSPPSFVLGNAGGLRSRGVEVEATVTPGAGLTLAGGVTYQDARFTDFKTTCFSQLEPIKLPVTTNPSGVGGCYTIPGTTTSFTQAAGSPIPNASKWNFTLNAAYKHEVGAMLLEANATYLHRSDFYTNGADPNTRVPGYGVVNASLSVGPANGPWTVGVYARNLFDTYYVSAIETGIFDAGGLTNVINVEARRTIGAQFDLRY